VNKFTGMDLKSIYLTDEQILELQEKCQKLNYTNLYCCQIDYIFEHIENICLVNDKLDIRYQIREASGVYDYDGTDSSCALAYLYTTTRFSNLNTFKVMLDEFSGSEEESFTDNIHIKIANIPDNIYDLLVQEQCDQSYSLFCKRPVMDILIRYNHLPMAKADGNLVDCDFLLSLSSLNKNKEIHTFLSQLKGHVLFTFCDGDDEELDSPKIFALHKRFTISPRKKFKPDRDLALMAFLRGYEVVNCGDVKIYRLTSY